MKDWLEWCCGVSISALGFLQSAAETRLVNDWAGVALRLSLLSDVRRRWPDDGHLTATLPAGLLPVFSLSQPIHQNELELSIQELQPKFIFSFPILEDL